MGAGRASASRILCRKVTRPGSRGGEVKNSGRVTSNAAALAFPLVVGDVVATEMRGVTRNMVLVGCVGVPDDRE